MCRVKLIGLLCSVSVLVASQAPAAAAAALNSDRSSQASIVQKGEHLAHQTKPAGMAEEPVLLPVSRADPELWALMAGGFAAVVMVMRRKKKPPSVTS